MTSLLSALISQHPLLLVMGVVEIVAAGGCALILFHERALFGGYSKMQKVAKSICSRVEGQLFRDGDDLVVSGFYRSIPAVFRFSNAENTPAVHISLRVTSRFEFSVCHRSVENAEGRSRISSGDEAFDQRFTIRTNQPETTRTLFMHKSVLREMKSLCCCPTTLVTLRNEYLELSEIDLPDGDILKHLLGHLDSLAAVAVKVGALSKGRARTRIYVRDRFVLARIALGILAFAALVEVFTAIGDYRPPEVQANVIGLPNPAVPVEDQQLLPAAAEWRLARDSDFDATTLTWFRDRGMESKSQYTGGFDGSGSMDSAAYILVPADIHRTGEWRVVILAHHKRLLDASFKNVLAAVRVPHRVLGKISSKSEADGDGLMLVSQSGDSQSAVIFGTNRGQLQSETTSSAWSAGLQDN